MKDKAIEKKDHSWAEWRRKKDRFKATGSTLKTKALKNALSGTSHFSSKTYKHD